MPQSRALIFANGDLIYPEKVKWMLQPGDFVIAVDGGLRHVDALGLKPDLLIGDLDSVVESDVERVEQNHGQVMRFPVHKDETDLELALLFAAKNGLHELVILGALGGRLDMTLGNIFLLRLPELAGCDARLDDGVEEVFFLDPGEPGREIIGNAGDRVSLLPWGGPAAGIRTGGLHYPLRGETLYPERSRGISNQMTTDRANVVFESGLLIGIHTRTFPQS